MQRRQIGIQYQPHINRSASVSVCNFSARRFYSAHLPLSHSLTPWSPRLDFLFSIASGTHRSCTRVWYACVRGPWLRREHMSHDMCHKIRYRYRWKTRELAKDEHFMLSLSNCIEDTENDVELLSPLSSPTPSSLPLPPQQVSLNATGISRFLMLQRKAPTETYWFILLVTEAPHEKWHNWYAEVFTDVSRSWWHQLVVRSQLAEIGAISA